MFMFVMFKNIMFFENYQEQACKTGYMETGM
jgi:hypothetical protein